MSLKKITPTDLSKIAIIGSAPTALYLLQNIGRNIDVLKHEIKSISIFEKEENTGGYFDPNTGNVYLSNNKMKDGTFNNYYDLINTLEHEASLSIGHKGEKIANRKYQYTDHAQIYFNQAGTDAYSNSTDDNKYSVAAGYATRIANAYSNNEVKTIEDAHNLINKFNVNNSGNVNIDYEQVGSGMGRYKITIGGQSYQWQAAKRLEKPQN